MNNLSDSFKIISFGILLTFLMSACNKTLEPIEIEPVVVCDFVTINVTNELDNDIIGLSINNESIGDVKSGETISEICLDQIMVDFGITYPLLQLIGTYDDVLIGEDFGFCGVGVTMVNTGVYDIKITDAGEYAFVYNNL